MFTIHHFYSAFVVCVFFFKQNTAYEMRISDWSSDVCSSDLFDGDTLYVGEEVGGIWELKPNGGAATARMVAPVDNQRLVADVEGLATIDYKGRRYLIASSQGDNAYAVRSEEHTSELQSLMRTSYAVF